MSLVPLHGWEFNRSQPLGEQPPTRPSLLHKIRTPDDYESWCRFVDLYGPGIYHLCRKKGLQAADANEIMQEVLLEIYRHIGQFEYDPDRGRFRGWLTTVIHSRLCRFWKKESRIQSESIEDQYETQTAQSFVEESLIEALTQRALDEIKATVEIETWRAFELTWLQNLNAEEAASYLGRPIGWVYVSKSRLLKKLTGKVREMGTDLGWLDSPEEQDHLNAIESRENQDA